MNFKKELTGVAAKVAEIMEAELSAKQKAIAKLDHPKHKIDAGDLAKLRAGHKPVKEEAEQVEEGIEDRIEAARKKAKAAGKKVEEPKKPAAPAKRKVEGGAYGGAKQKEEMEESVLPFTTMLEAYTEHGLKAFVKEQVEEEIQEEVDYLEEAKDGKIDLTHAFKQHGLHYHMTDYYTNSGARKGRSVKSHEEAMKRIHKKVSDDHGPKVAEDMHKHSQSMANSWYRGDDAPKSASALRAKHKVKWDGDIDKVDDKPDPKFHKEEVQFNEEVDNETYTKEVEDQKASMEGKKKQPKVAAASTQGVKIMDEEEQIEEEIEYLDEGQMNKMSLGQLMHKHAQVYSQAGSTKYGKRQHSAEKAIENRVKEYGAIAHQDMMDHSDYHQHFEDGNEKTELTRQQRNRYHHIRGKYNIGESVEQIEERTLSEPETKKKEEYVKGMKKKLSGFKQRYGERAKEVLYATATKMAKKD